MTGAPTRAAQPLYIRQVGDGVELRIKVVPGASRSKIESLLGDRLKVRVAAPAEHGKANRAAIELLRDWLSVKDIVIVAGHASAQKTVRIAGLGAVGYERLAELSRGNR